MVEPEKTCPEPGANGAQIITVHGRANGKECAAGEKKEKHDIGANA